MVTIRSVVSLISLRVFLPGRSTSTTLRLDTLNSLRAIETTSRRIHQLSAPDRECARLERLQNPPAQEVSDTGAYSKAGRAPGAFRSIDAKLCFPDTSQRR